VSFVRTLGRGTAQKGHLADLRHIHDVNPIPHVDDDGALLLSQKNLFGMTDDNDFAIDPYLKCTKGPVGEGGFEIHSFHGLNVTLPVSLASSEPLSRQAPSDWEAEDFFAQETLTTLVGCGE
jgi:hypothetical protein